MTDLHSWIASDAGRELGVSVKRIHQLDEALQPARDSRGWRRYNPAVVRQYAATRGQK